MVRQEVGQEDDYGVEYQSLDLVFAVFLGVVVSAYGSQDVLIGGQQQVDGEEEVYQEAVVVDVALLCFQGVVFKVDVVLVFVFYDFFVYEEVDVGQQFFDLDDYVDVYGRFQGAELVEAEGMGYGQVAVDRDVVEEVYVDVDVFVEEDVIYLVGQVFVRLVVVL